MKKIKFLIALFFIIPLFVHAQLGTQATIKLIPSNPAPYEVVTLTLISYNMDIDNAKVTWQANGKNIASGVGIKSIKMTTGGVGSNIPILVKAENSSGQSIEISINVSPQNVDIIWESPESYTPPFYEGKALPGEGSVVKVFAVPNMSNEGKTISPSDISYAWYVNDEYRDNVSGRGKQVANIALDYLSDETLIKVKARNDNGNVAEKTITIIPHEIMPLFYLYDEILGINLSKLIIQRIETIKEVSLSLVPYYFSVNGSDTYVWFLNSSPFFPQEKFLLKLKPENNSAGIKKLEVIISNAKRKLQKAQTELTIVFDTRK